MAVSRLWRWEFWPRRAFYAPMVPLWALLALRHRTLTAWTACNPCMPHGGVVGERKHDVLLALDPAFAQPTLLLRAGDAAARADRLENWLRAHAFDWPIILKPDVGERGTGVRLVRTPAQALAHMRQHAGIDLLAQTYHPGPHECGILYARHPRTDTGFIFSITTKVFPELHGDGRSTLAQLLWAHPRHRMQADLFLERMGAQADRVPGAGERVALAVAGNHCQGTMFTDGAHMVTPALTASIDRLARSVDEGRGLYMARFDVRYQHQADLLAGHGYRVLEVNGVLGESTNIYDPRRTLLQAYVTLARQWHLALAIGRANARAGRARPTGARELLRVVRAHLARPHAREGAD